MKKIEPLDISKFHAGGELAEIARKVNEIIETASVEVVMECNHKEHSHHQNENCTDCPPFQLEQKIEHIERAKKVGLIPEKDARDVRKWMPYANQQSREAMKLYKRAEEALK